MNENKIISNVFDIREIFNILNVIVDECRIYILEDGLKISSISPTNISSISMDISGTNFHDYNIENPFIVELNTSEILKILEDKRDPIEITIESIFEDNIEKYKIRFNFGKIVHSFISSKIKDTDKRKTILVSTEDNAKISISLKYFREIIKSCSYVSDCVLFENKDNKLRVYSKDDFDCSDVEAFIEGDITGVIKSLFGIEHLKNMADRINISNNSTITLYIGVDWPITMEFNVCKYGKGTYTVAPRIYSDI